MARTPDQIISDMCDVAMTLTMSMSQVDLDSMTPVQYGTVDEAFAAMHGQLHDLADTWLSTARMVEVSAMMRRIAVMLELVAQAGHPTEPDEDFEQCLAKAIQVLASLRAEVWSMPPRLVAAMAAITDVIETAGHFNPSIARLKKGADDVVA